MCVINGVTEGCEGEKQTCSTSGTDYVYLNVAGAAARPGICESSSKTDPISTDLRVEQYTVSEYVTITPDMPHHIVFSRFDLF